MPQVRKLRMYTIWTLLKTKRQHLQQLVAWQENKFSIGVFCYLGAKKLLKLAKEQWTLCEWKATWLLISKIWWKTSLPTTGNCTHWCLWQDRSKITWWGRLFCNIYWWQINIFMDIWAKTQKRSFEKIH